MFHWKFGVFCFEEGGEGLSKAVRLVIDLFFSLSHVLFDEM